jgi:dihydroorotase
LYFTDEATKSFDANYKLLPPLRSEEDRLALVKGLKEGVIDAVSSGHTPTNIETKFCEFDNAEFGGISLEASFGALNKTLGEEFSDEDIIRLIATNPSKILGINLKIDEKEKANITLFKTKGSTHFGKSDIECFSKNSPFIGAELKGKVIGVINNNQLKLI